MPGSPNRVEGKHKTSISTNAFIFTTNYRGWVLLIDFRGVVTVAFVDSGTYWAFVWYIHWKKGTNRYWVPGFVKNCFWWRKISLNADLWFVWHVVLSKCGPVFIWTGLVFRLNAVGFSLNADLWSWFSVQNLCCVSSLVCCVFHYL